MTLTIHMRHPFCCTQYIPRGTLHILLRVYVTIHTTNAEITTTEMDHLVHEWMSGILRNLILSKLKNERAWSPMPIRLLKCRVFYCDRLTTKCVIQGVKLYVSVEIDFSSLQTYSSWGETFSRVIHIHAYTYYYPGGSRTSLTEFSLWFVTTLLDSSIPL